MSTNIKQKQLKPYHGIGVFILVVLMLPFVAAPIQREWGMYGLAITELMILLFSLIPAIIFKVDLKEIFPIKKPLIRQVFGVLFIWAGCYIAILLLSLVILYFFPEGITEVSSELHSVITSVPMGVAFFIIAIMPAICEEALHRGLILSSFASIKKKWVTVLLMGVIFGIFHLDPYRFLPTAILGMAITYIMIETENIVLPVLFHFINNASSTFASFATKTQDMQLAELNRGSILISISSYLIIGAIIPFLLLLGSRLIHSKEVTNETEDTTVIKKRKSKRITATVFCSVLMVMLGVTTMALNLNRAPVFESSISMDVNGNTDPLNMPMKIEESGEYMLELDIESERGLININITDEHGEEIYQMSCKKAISNGFIKLENTTYTINVDFLMDIKEIEEYYGEKGISHNVDLKEELNLNGDLDELTSFRMSLIVR